MPTYDYECDACGHKFELRQQISEEPKKKCPACRKAKLRRLFGTGAALVFKGSGFYQTDYRSESYKKAAAADSKPAADNAATKSESKSTESKSESKSESTPAPSKTDVKTSRTKKDD